MISELGRNLFASLLIEVFALILAILFRDDKRKMVVVLGIGTIVAGAVGFGPQILASLQNVPPTLEQTARPTATTRSLVPDFQAISLKSWSELTSPETNLGLGPGLNYLLDIPFETGWKASTQCSHLPNQPELIRLDTNISNPTNVYLLIQAGWGLTKYAGKQIGNVRLGFSDGSTFDTPLVLGFNIRDWAWKSPAAVNTASSPTLQPALEGKAPDGTPGGMDILTISVPSNLSRSRLTSIQISDVSQQTTGEINPCIHLVALTVKYMR